MLIRHSEKNNHAESLKMLKDHNEGRRRNEKNNENTHTKKVLTLSLSTTVPTGLFSGTLTTYISCVNTGLLSSTSVTRTLRVRVVRRGSTAPSEASTTTSYWLLSSRSNGTLV